MELNFNQQIGERKCLVRLKEIKERLCLRLIKKGFLDSSKNEIFSGVNDLYKVEEQKVRVNDNNFIWRKSEFN